MPLEGHWQRTNTPLRSLSRRERRLIAAAAVLVAAIALAIALVGASASSPPLARGCFEAIVPGAMGGQPIDACGARARAVCAQHAHGSDPGSRAVEASCRRAGIAF